MSDATVHGKFVWHELLTTDPKAAARFFSKVIGWKPKAWEVDAAYTIFHSGDRGVAGLMALPDAARKTNLPPHWLSYIGTADVDQTLALATSLGANVRNAPEDVPNAGRFAVLEDPHGAVFGIYSPDQSRPETPPAVGDFSWHELATTDARRAFSFYQQLFGWEQTSAMDMGAELGMYHMFGRSKSGPPMGGIFAKPPQMPGPANWLPYIKVADARNIAGLVKKHGGRVVNGPMEVPGGDWIAQGLDLQSAMFAVHSATPPATQSYAAPKLRRSAKAAKPATAARKKRAAATETAKTVRRTRAKTAAVPKRANKERGQARTTRTGVKRGAARMARKAARPKTTGRKSRRR